MKWRIPALMMCGLALVANVGQVLRAADSLTFYFVDVEGGNATLIVTPSGQSMLIDTGWATPPGRDPRRILAAAKDAGVTRLDYLLLTHFHEDHLGGVPDLAKRIEIGAFIDHDNIVGNDAQAVRPFNAYVPVRKKAANHIVVKAGDRLPLTDVEATVVSSAGQTLRDPLPGAGESNGACRDKPLEPHERIENPRSTGYRLRFGSFRYLELGDLSGKPLFALACPKNLVGPVDVYVVPHHGNDDVADAGAFAAFKPRVAIMNNGDEKGGGPKLFKMLHKVSLEDVWQLHRSDNRGSENFADDQIANLDTRTAHWIKLSAERDGSFTVTNGRTGASKAYPPRPATTSTQ